MAGSILSLRRWVMALLALSLPHGAYARERLSLYLTCQGSGERTVVNRGIGIGANGGAKIAGRHIGDSVSGSIGSLTSKAQFTEQIDISLVDSKARARLPHRFLPFINNNRKGWVTIAGTRVSREQITGNVDLNLTNRPRIRIDRISGSITMDGKVGAFYGQCRAVDPDSTVF